MILTKEQHAEMVKQCNGCVLIPKYGENFDEICASCSRFYSDNYDDGYGE